MERSNKNKITYRNNDKNSLLIKQTNDIDMNLDFLENLRIKKETELNSLIQLRKRANEIFHGKVI